MGGAVERLRILFKYIYMYIVSSQGISQQPVELVPRWTVAETDAAVHTPYEKEPIPAGNAVCEAPRLWRWTGQL